MMDRLRPVGYDIGMSDVAYFDYALVLPEERYLIEVQSRNPATGETRSDAQLKQLAAEALLKVVGEGRQHLHAKFEPQPMTEADALNLTKVQQLATSPDYSVFLVE